MPEPDILIDELIIKYLQQTLPEKEQARLDEWVKASSENKELFERLTDHQYISEKLDKLYSYDEEKGWSTIRKNFPFNPAKPINPPVPIRRINWKKLTVAASIVLALGIGSYFIFVNKTKQNEIVKNTNTVPHDIAPPKTSRAMIALADGRTVLLDSLTSGTLAMQGNVKVNKTTDGQIIYDVLRQTQVDKAVEYNVLFNPRGSKVQPLTLSDGTKVWLNAESSIRFPTAFAGNERKIFINGEAYFEVVHNSIMPFKVSKGEMEISVVGTHFNVNAYDDEADIKVTLLEGSVRVNNIIIKPGQQAQVGNEVKVVSGVNIDKVMAWKNGYFHFGNTTIQDLMKQIARWYDVEIVYKGKIQARQFGGEISREANLSQVLKILNESKIKCRIEGKRLIIE